MDTDIRDEIERSFGDGPPLTGEDDLLRRARGRLRRRRLAESASALAVVVVAVTTVSLIAPGGDGAPSPAGPAGGAASHGSAPGSASPTSATPAPSQPAPAVVEDAGIPARWGPMTHVDGPHVSPRLRIHRTWEDPWNLDLPAGGWSFALTYDAPGIPLTWWVGYLDGGGSSASIPADQADGLTFAAWVAEQREIYLPRDDGQGAEPDGSATPPGGWPGMTDLQLVRFIRGTERLEPLDAVTLLRQRAHPELPASWAQPGDRSAVAEVVFEGARYYALARSTPEDGAPQYIAVKAARGGSTLDDFLALARERYAEGGGGLL